MGGWHELWGIEHSLPAVGERVHRRRLPQISAMLWEKSAPVAWVEETGRRVTRINERTLVRRWVGVDAVQGDEVS